MKVKSLQIKKFKGLKDFNLEFNDDLTVLIGENGTGKTTILDTIFYLITYRADTTSTLHPGFGKENSRNDLYISETVSSAYIRRKDHFTSSDKDFAGCKINLDIQQEKNWFIEGYAPHESVYKYVEDKKILELELGRNPNNGVAYRGDWGVLSYLSTLTVFGNKRSNVPHIVFLPAEINFKKYKVESVKKVNEFIEFGLMLDSEAVSSGLKDFLVYQHHRDLEDMAEGKKGNRIKKYKELYNKFFEDKEFLGVKDLEPLFKIKSSGEIHSVDELSSGEKQIFFRAGSILEYELENSIILIDEPEISMHPEWQQKILEFYREVAGNNQLIIATHSPHIVSSCKKEEVRVLTREDARVEIREYIDGTYGRTIEQLLLSVFDLESVRDKDVQKKIDKFKNLYLNKEKLDRDKIEKMQELKNELMGYLDPDDPELSLINIEKSTNNLKNLLDELEGK
jgi:predicted ATPase